MFNKNTLKIKLVESSAKKIGCDPITFASIYNQFEIIPALIKKGWKGSSSPNLNGTSALHVIVKKTTEHQEDLLINIFQSLIDNGADVNCQDNNGNTPLHELMMCDAFSSYNMRKLDVLLNQKEYSTGNNIINIDIQNSVGNTPLHTAATKGPHDTLSPFVKRLKEAGAKTNIKSRDGSTAADYARESGRIENANFLSQ